MLDDEDALSQAGRRGCRAFARHDGASIGPAQQDMVSTAVSAV